MLLGAPGAEFRFWAAATSCGSEGDCIRQPPPPLPEMVHVGRNRPAGQGMHVFGHPSRFEFGLNRLWSSAGRAQHRAWTPPGRLCRLVWSATGQPAGGSELLPIGDWRFDISAPVSLTAACLTAPTRLMCRWCCLRIQMRIYGPWR